MYRWRVHRWSTRAKLIVIVRIASDSLPERATHFLAALQSSTVLVLHHGEGKQRFTPENSQPVRSLRQSRGNDPGDRQAQDRPAETAHWLPASARRAARPRRNRDTQQQRGRGAGDGLPQRCRRPWTERRNQVSDPRQEGEPVVSLVRRCAWPEGVPCMCVTQEKEGHVRVVE